MNRFRRRLYRVQQRLAITRIEATVVLGLSFLLLIGAVVTYVQRQPRTLREPPEAARSFAAGTAMLHDSSGTVPSLPEARPHRGRINVNVAPQEELERLPRIGPVMAQRIIDYRETHGPFERVEELSRVRGIGPKTLERLRPLVVLTTPGPTPAAADSSSGTAP